MRLRRDSRPPPRADAVIGGVSMSVTVASDLASPLSTGIGGRSGPHSLQPHPQRSGGLPHPAMRVEGCQNPHQTIHTADGDDDKPTPRVVGPTIVSARGMDQGLMSYSESQLFASFVRYRPPRPVSPRPPAAPSANSARREPPDRREWPRRRTKRPPVESGLRRSSLCRSTSESFEAGSGSLTNVVASCRR